MEAVEAEGRKSPLPLKVANSKQRRKGKSRAFTTRIERKNLASFQILDSSIHLFL